MELKLGIFYKRTLEGYEMKFHYLETEYKALGSIATYDFGLLKGDVVMLEHVVANRDESFRELYFGEDVYLKSNHLTTIVNYFFFEHGVSEDYQYEIPTAILIEILKKYVAFVEKNPL